jgi:ArsR family transcriptional regulator
MKDYKHQACSLAANKIEDEEAARIYAALAHPVRLTIIRQLSLEEACCKDIVGGLDLAQSTVSQHLKVLVQAGLVAYRADKQNSRYSVNHARLDHIKDHFSQLSLLCVRPPTCD